MQTNRMEHDLWIEAVLTLCPHCEEGAEGCGEMESCVKIAERIVERKAEIAAEG